MKYRGRGVALQTKGFWAENITTDASRDRLKQHLTDTGANLLCIRSESPYIRELMSELQPQGIKVYAWRWPNLFPDPAAGPNPAVDDTQYWQNELVTAQQLITAGIDGYIFDIESDDGIHSKKHHYLPYPHDWDNPTISSAERATAATTFANGISKAFTTRHGPYLLGLTSHQWGFSNYPDIPWQPFLDVCNALFPQTYWYADGSDNNVKDCGPVSYDYSTHPLQPVCTPDQAIKNGFTDYANKKNASGAILPIFPIAGEIGCAKFGEITHFGELVAQRRLTQAHFYVDVDAPGWNSTANAGDPRVLAEIKAL
jgi:hypothetical protein